MVSTEPSKVIDYGLLAALALLWGSSFLFIKLALDGIPPLTVVAARTTISAAVLAGVVVMMGERWPRGLRAWMPFLLLGILLNSLPYALITWGQQHITAGLAAILMSVAPTFTLFAAHFLTADEHLSLRKGVGVALGILGVVVIIGFDALEGLGTRTLAQLAIVVAAAFWAFSGLLARHIGRTTPPLVAAACSMFSGALATIPISLAFDRPWTLDPSAEALISVALLALLATAIGQIVYFGLLRRAGATFTSSVNYLLPLTGSALGIVFLGEPFRWVAAVALALILTGIGLIRASTRIKTPLPDRLG